MSEFGRRGDGAAGGLRLQDIRQVQAPGRHRGTSSVDRRDYSGAEAVDFEKLFLPCDDHPREALVHDAEPQQYDAHA